MTVSWEGENVRIFHPREPWGSLNRDHYVLVHRRLDELYGKGIPYDGTRDWYQIYLNAKRDGDKDCAREVIARSVSKPQVDILAEAVAELLVREQPPPLIVFPLSIDFVQAESFQFIPGKSGNALPAAFSYYLTRRLGCPADRDIYQISTVRRTRLMMRARLLHQPAFKGGVIPGRYYIIIDDVVTLGGTIAALRSHILRGGGKIAAVTSLAHKEGANVPLAIHHDTVSQLLIEYRNDLDKFLVTSFGHGIRELTQGEGLFLLYYAKYEWKDIPKGERRLELLRNRINREAMKGAATQQLPG